METTYPLKEIKTKQSQIRQLSGGVLCGIESIDLKMIQSLPKGYFKWRN